MTSRQKISNIIFFQMAWWSCVLSAQHNLPAAGIAATLVVIGMHLLIFKNRKSELVLVVQVSVFGFIFDSILIQTHLMSIKGQWGVGLSPLWLVAIWGAFATTLRISFSWLQGKFILSFLLGGLFGGVTYYGVQSFGVAQILEPTNLNLALLTTAWAIAFPLTIQLSRKF